MEFKVGNKARFKTEDEVKELVSDMDEFFQDLISAMIEDQRKAYKAPIIITKVSDDRDFIRFESQKDEEPRIPMDWLEPYSDVNDPDTYETTEEGFITHKENWNGLGLL